MFNVKQFKIKYFKYQIKLYVNFRNLLANTNKTKLTDKQ